MNSTSPANKPARRHSIETEAPLRHHLAGELRASLSNNKGGYDNSINKILLCPHLAAASGEQATSSPKRTKSNRHAVTKKIVSFSECDAIAPDPDDAAAVEENEEATDNQSNDVVQERENQTLVGCPHHTKTNLSTAVVSSTDDNMTPRQVVEKAEAINLQCGNENAGTLSFTHGFAPRLTPKVRLPPQFKAWDDLADRAPELLSSGRLRKYCYEELPMLNGEELPPEYAWRAALVLGYSSQALWNLGGIDPVKKLPPALEEPWRAVSKMLGRETPFLGFSDLIVHNFKFDENEVPSLPTEMDPCPWGETRVAGSVDYDPSKATVLKIRPSYSLTGSDEEAYFNNTMAELHCRGAPMVQLVVEAQEAVGTGDIAHLKKCLVEITELLNCISYEIFNQISQVKKATTHVSTAFWAKIIGPVSIPIFSNSLHPSLFLTTDDHSVELTFDALSHNIGPSSSFPFIHLFDAFFGRVKEEGFVGKDKRRLLPSLPIHWQDFFRAIKRGPNVVKFVDDSGDNELKGLFGAALRSYAGNEGFLGRHKLKMYGYLECVMKLGRTITIAGFGGQFTDRAWDKTFNELKIGQRERFDIEAGVLTTSVHKARIIKQREEDVTNGWGSVLHVRIDTTGCGIRYRPGSRVGVLWQSSDELVHETLLAFSNGRLDPEELGKTHYVKLSDAWRSALRNRSEYHCAMSADDPLIPVSIPLKTFLKYADLRPVTRSMLHTAYRVCGSPLIAQLLEHHLESSLQFPDVITLIKQTGSSILSLGGDKTDKDEALKLVFDSIDSDDTGCIESYELESLCTAAGIVPSETPEIREILRNFDQYCNYSLCYDEFKNKLSHIFGEIDLCDLLPPANFRVYSVASSPSVNANEISLYVRHLRYEQFSASAPTTPLLAGIQPKELKYGAASDYLTRESMPVKGRAIMAARELSLQTKGNRIPMSPKNIIHLMLSGRLTLTQAEKVFEFMDEKKSSRDFKGSDLDAIAEAIDLVLSNACDDSTTSDEVILFHFEPPRFKLPSIEDDAPIVMIAGGTGIAPFRSFWQERAMRKRNNVPRDLLILQMRNRDEFSTRLGSELASLVAAGLLQVEIMLSREDYSPSFDGGQLSWKEMPGRRGYIDKLITGDLYDHLTALVRDHKAYLYVCGRGGLARTSITALNDALSSMKGGKYDIIERMFASNHIQLEVFTTLKAPEKDVLMMDLSELCTYNDFVGNRGKGSVATEKQLLMAIEGEIYDVKSFLQQHPGGAEIMHLYCGMDATKAWRGVEHDKAPEIVGMLEMFITTPRQRLRNVAQEMGMSSQRLWYAQGWRPMASKLVEAQNILALSYSTLWDTCLFTKYEEDSQMHWCTFNGETRYCTKRSIFKGQKCVEVHIRLWVSFLPILLGREFRRMVTGNEDFIEDKKQPIGNRNSFRSTLRHKKRATVFRSARGMKTSEKIFEPIKECDDHDACDVIGTLLLQDVNAEAEDTDNDGMLSSNLQAVLERVRYHDETLLENVKKSVIRGLVAFEDAASTANNDIVTDVGTEPSEGIDLIVAALTTYVHNVARVAREYFGEDRVNEMVKKLNAITIDEDSSDDGASDISSKPMRGGLHLIGSDKLEYDFIERKLVDNSEGVKVKFGEESREAKKCPFSS